MVKFILLFLYLPYINDNIIFKKLNLNLVSAQINIYFQFNNNYLYLINVLDYNSFK